MDERGSEMSLQDPDREDTTIYKVVVNQEEQYSIWPEDKKNPLGWNDFGRVGPKAECLEYIKEIWTDMRPLSLRKRMAEMARTPAPTPSVSDSNRPRQKSLIDRLCEGDHSVKVSLHPKRAVKLFKEIRDCNYLPIKFTDTKGETELGVRLDHDACDLSLADFENGTGSIHVEGGITLNYVKLRCIADIDLATQKGKGHLIKVKMEEEN